MKNKNINKMGIVFSVLSVICMLVFVVLGVVSSIATADAAENQTEEITLETVSEVILETVAEGETYETAETYEGLISTEEDVLETEEDELGYAETIVSSISGTSQELAMQIEMWQEYIDKYIMPNAMAVLTGLGMVVAVFSKFKTLVSLYQTDKEAFDAEKDGIFAELKEQVSSIIETLGDVKETTTASIDNMPISAIQVDLALAKEALIAET